MWERARHDCVLGISSSGTRVEKGSAKELDVSCLSKILRPPFTLISPIRKAVPMAEAERARFIGRYAGESRPIEARVTEAKGKLRIEFPGEPSLVLVPVSADAFQVAGVLGVFVTFERVDGKPVALRVLRPGGDEFRLVVRPVTPGS